MSILGTTVRTGVDVARRAGEAAAALPRIALALERLAASSDDLRKLAAASDDVRRVLNSLSDDDVAVVREALQQLVDVVSQLNGVVGSLNTTISPLQGATDRLGRLVDRLPASRRRVVDAPPGSFT
jgi:ABC-type transporter Mla subunit MlaD